MRASEVVKRQSTRIALVALLLPRSLTSRRRLWSGDAAVQALSNHHPDFNLGHIQPTAMSVVNLQPFERAALRQVQILVPRWWVQVVQHQHNPGSRVASSTSCLTTRAQSAFVRRSVTSTRRHPSNGATQPGSTRPRSATRNRKAPDGSPATCCLLVSSRQTRTSLSPYRRSAR